MKLWQGLLSSALVLGSLCISNICLALTPGYYVRMDNDRLTGRLIVLEHKGTISSESTDKNCTLKLVSITDTTNEEDNFSINAFYYDLKKNLSVTDKALVYVGQDYDGSIHTNRQNFVRFYEEQELLPLKLEEKGKNLITVTSTEPKGENFNGTYTREETFYQATHPLTVFAIEQLANLQPSITRTYIFDRYDNDINYHVTALENGQKIAQFYVRLDLSKIRDENGYKNLFISDFARAYEAEQAKKAKG